jgi:diguanylate cyclase (GGDEF)-like protein
MNRNKISTLYKIALIIFGSICFAYSVFNLKPAVFSWGFFVLLMLACIVAPRLCINIPHSKFAVTFSDPLIFLAFLFYGGEAAIFLATFGTLATGLYLRSNGMTFESWIVPTNAGLSSLSVTVTYFVWASLTSYTGINIFSANTTNIVITLSILAITQFFASSGFVAVLYLLTNTSNSWQMWKKDCLSSSLTQVTGAGLAGIIFKFIYTADFLTITLASVTFGIIYLTYREMIRDMNEAVIQAEQAEHKKAEAEKKRAEEAELNLAKVNSLFEEQEKISQDLQMSKEALERAAYYDSLTGLFNRTYLIERLELLLDLDIDIANKYYVLFLDINRFKNINDSLGHPIGDKVLTLVAKRLKHILRDEDTISRLGGDEFAIILNDLSSIEEAEFYARRIHRKLSQPYSTEGHKIYIDLNVGISPFDVEHLKPEDILRDADIAMHHAKANASNIGVFDKELRRRFLENVKLESELRFAVNRNELALYYQPVISLTDGTLVGFETLLRWQHPKYGFISPVQFIPIAEESGMIIPITIWILREACLQLAQWKKIIPNTKHLKFSINISGKHLAVENLPEQVLKALEESNLDATSLILEITESSAMENAEQTIRIFEKLRKIGVSISIDDFGTGYSSLSYLHRLPFDSLKIDRSFVSDVNKQTENAQILQTIVSLAQNLNLRTVAEGIETVEQLKILKDLGCDLGQGFLFSKPLPKDEIENLLYEKSQWLPPTGENIADTNLTYDISQDNLHVF